MLRQVFSTAGVVVALLAGVEARAVVIQFSTSGDSERIDLDNGSEITITGPSRSDWVDLQPGVARWVRLNLVDFSTDFASPGGADGNALFSQSLTIVSPAATPSSYSFSQNLAVDVTPFNPLGGGQTTRVTLGASALLEFDLGALGTLRVAPAGGMGDSGSGDGEFENRAQFLLVPVPEPTAAMVLVGGGLLVAIRRRRAV